MQKAIFLDRDGPVVRMFYNNEHGTVESPINPSQVELTDSIADLIKYTKGLGFLNIVISNQPAIGLGKVNKKTFEEITEKIHFELKKRRVSLDDEYYCFHHPFAKIDKYREKCSCRKPKQGLILQAAKEHDIDLSKSWMIGDGANDVIAGKRAGVKTILYGNVLESEYLSVMKEKLGKENPDFMIKNLKEIKKIIK